MANGILSQFPDLSVVVTAQTNVQTGFGAVALPSDPGSLVQALVTSLAALQNAVPSNPAELVASLTASLDTLAAAFPQEQLPAIQQFHSSLSDLLNVLEPVRTVLGERNLADLVFERAGDPAALISSLLSSLADLLPAESIDVLRTFVNTLRNFETNIPSNPEAVAGFLAESFLGVPLSLLAEPARMIDALDARIAALADPVLLGRFESRIQATVSKFGELAVEIRTLEFDDAAGYRAAIARLRSVQADLGSVAELLLQLAARFQSGLAALNPAGIIGDLQRVFSALPEIRVARTEDFANLVLEPLQELRARLDAVTPADVTQALGEFRGRMAALIEQQQYAELRTMMLKPFADIGELISDLDLNQFRSSIEQFLGTLGNAVSQVTASVSTVRVAMTAACDQIDAALKTVTTAGNDAEQAIQGVSQTIEQALDAVPLQSFQTQASAVIGQVKDLLDNFEQTLTPALDQVNGFVGQLEQIDLQLAAEPALDVIRSLQERLEAVDLSLLSEAEAGPFRLSVSVLAEIDLSPVQAALLDEFEQFDPGVLFDRITAGVNGLTEKIGQYNPPDLLAPLIEGFEQLRDRLREFDPAVLLNPAIAPLETFQLTIGNLDQLLREPLAPLVVQFDKLRAKLNELAPTRLLAPLRDLFDDFMQLFEKLDVIAMLDDLDVQLGQRMEQALTGAQSVANGLSGADDLKSYLDGLSSTPTQQDFGYNPGDVLQPAVDVFNKIMELVNRVPDETLLSAFETLKRRFVDEVDAIAPSMLPSRISRELNGGLSRFDLTGNFQVVADLYSAYNKLVAAMDSIDDVRVAVALRADYNELATLVVNVNPELSLAPLRPSLRVLNRDVATLGAAIDPSGLVAAFGQVQERIEAIVPPFLTGELTVAGVKSELEKLNPARLAEAVNEQYQQLLIKVLDFGDVLVAELPKLGETIRGGVSFFGTSALREAFNAVYEPLKTQLQSLNPAPLIEALETGTFAPIAAAMDSLHPNAILDALDLTGKTAQFVKSTGEIIDALKTLQATLSLRWDQTLKVVETYSPAQLQETLNTAFSEIQLTAKQRLEDIAETLNQLLRRLRDDLDRVLQDAETAMKDLVAALPS